MNQKILAGGLVTLLAGAGLFAAAGLAAGDAAAQTPKRGGILTFMVPSEAPPSFDSHRESTYATIHLVAPFYSTLIRVNPDNPASPTDFVCDLCTAMPQPADGGTTYSFNIRTGVKFHDGSALTSADVLVSWNKIVNPQAGQTSARHGFYSMVESITAPDPTTVVFKLKYATTAFLPALADPFATIYPKSKLDADPRWFEKNVLGSGPFRMTSYEIGQSMKGERNPDYYHPGQPYLDGFVAILTPRQSVRVDAIRADRAVAEFRGLPPASRDQLVKELGSEITVQEGDWNCGNIITFNHQKKPFDDVRVRRALALAVDQWRGAPPLSRIAIVNTVGGVVFPGSPLAATKEELLQMAGYWPDIEKSRAEARRLLKEAGAEGLQFELLNRNVDQPYKFVGTWLIDEWRKVGLQATQKVVPTNTWFSNMRSHQFDVVVEASCQSVVNPVLDVQKYLPRSVFQENYGNYEDAKQIEIYNKMAAESDPAKQRALMRDFERHTLDTEVHAMMTLWWHRIVPIRSYVKGWKISTSHYLNQDLANIWLDK